MIFNLKNVSRIEQNILRLKNEVSTLGLDLNRSLDLFCAYYEKGDLETARIFMEDESIGVLSKSENTYAHFYEQQYKNLIMFHGQKSRLLTPHNLKWDILITEKVVDAFRYGDTEKAVSYLNKMSLLSLHNPFYRGLQFIQSKMHEDFAYEYKNEIHWQHDFVIKIRKYLAEFSFRLGGEHDLKNHSPKIFSELIQLTFEINYEPWIEFREKDFIFTEKESKTMQLFLLMATFLIALKKSLGDEYTRDTIRGYIPTEYLEDLALVWSERAYVDRLFDMIDLFENPKVSNRHKID